MVSTTNQILVLTCVCVMITAGTFVASAAEPTVNIEVNNERFTDGSEIDVSSDPTVDISVTAETQISLIEVYVDGTAQRTFDPNGTSFEKEFQLKLDNGEHDIQVVAGANETTTIDGVITKDGGAPFIEYTEPFSTPDKSTPPDVTTVTEAQLNLSGDLFDDSGVRSIEIERRFEYRYANSRETSRATYEIDDPGDSFQQEILLGNGENEITATYIDEMGNQRRHDFSLVVDDRRGPQIDVSAPAQVTEPSATISATVTDNVKLQSVTITAPSIGNKQVVSSRSPEPNADRLQVKIKENIELSEGRNEVDIEATDVNGNSVSEELTVEYVRIIEPIIEIDGENTTVENNSVSVRGRIFRGEVTRASIQTRTASENGSKIIDIGGLYTKDSIAETVTINQTLTLAPNKTVTEIRVLATDSEGTQHEQSVWINSDTGVIGDSPSAVDGSSSPDMTPTPTTESLADTDADIDTNADSDTTDDDAADVETNEDTPTEDETTTTAVTTTPESTVSSQSSPGFGIIIAITAISLALIAIKPQR